MAPDLVRTQELVKRYKRREVVSGVNVDVQPGEVVGLLGPNGAGKTTTFYMIMGLVHPTAGQVFYKDVDVSKTPMYRRARMGMGYLAQEPSVFRNLTVAENVMAVLETMPMSGRERRAKLDELLGELDIAGLARQKAYTLSGGERRRLEITRALVTDPSLLLLDEPFNGVDPLAVIDVQNIITQLRDKGLGILITDHNVRETLAIVDRAYLMHEGKVLREGSSDFLIKDRISRELYLGDRFTL